MKPGDLVRSDVPGTSNHNRLGIILEVDKSMKVWPHDRIIYRVMLDGGEILNFRYEQLIFSEDLYFTQDDYFKTGVRLGGKVVR